MHIAEITKLAGAHKPRKRLGRGERSGHGKTCGKGNKGCQARAGGGVRRLTEGGQMPLFRRIPKRGFSNFIFQVNYDVVNVSELDKQFEVGAVVTKKTLLDKGLIQSPTANVKILGDGDLKKKLTVEADKFSKSAITKIKAAGGQAKELSAAKGS